MPGLANLVPESTTLSFPALASKKKPATFPLVADTLTVRSRVCPGLTVVRLGVMSTVGVFPPLWQLQLSVAMPLACANACAGKQRPTNEIRSGTHARERRRVTATRSRLWLLVVIQQAAPEREIGAPEREMGTRAKRSTVMGWLELRAHWGARAC